MDSSSIIRVQISLRTMIVIGFLRIHTALTPLPIAFTLLEAINKHTGEQRNWTKWRRHSKFSAGVLYEYVRVKGRNLQYSRSLHSSCKVPSECSKRTNIFLICIHFLSAHYLSLPPGLCLNYTSKEASFESIISSTNSWNYKTKPKVLLHYLLCLFWALPAFRQVDRKFPRIRKLNEILFRFLLAVAITITWMNRIKRTYP